MSEKVKTPVKAKRKLSDIDFSREDSHIAITCKSQGGSASGANYALVMKSNKNFTEEVVKKAQKIRVTMELPEFLETFFNLWMTDALVLAKMMGFDDTDSQYSENIKLYDGEEYYQKYIEDKLESFEIIKSLRDSDNTVEMFSKMTGEEYLSFLKDQETLEGLFIEIEKKNDLESVKKETEKSQKDELNKYKPKEDSKKMDEKEVEAMQKSLLDSKEELRKALEQVELFKAKEKESIQKARLQSVKDAVKDESKASVLFKAVSLIEDQAEFEAVVKTLKEMTDLIEQSEMFKETGVTTGESDVKKTEESPLMKAMKKQKIVE